MRETANIGVAHKQDGGVLKIAEGRLRLRVDIPFEPRLWLGPPQFQRWSLIAGDLVAWHNDEVPAPQAKQHMSSLREAADNGDPEALVLVGLATTVGYGVLRDESAAVRSLSHAQRHGDPLGRTMHGLALLFGRGVDQDLVAAAELIGEAAGAGNALAQYVYGNMLEYGLGVTASAAAARSTLESAKKQGFPPAINSLGFAMGPFRVHAKAEDGKLP